MDFSIVIRVLISSIFVVMFFIYCGKKLLSININFSVSKVIFIIFFIGFITVNYLFLDNIVKVVTAFACIMFSYKIIFKKNIAQCALATFIAYTLLVIGELLFVLGISITNMKDSILNDSVFHANSIANLLICILGILILQIIYKPISKSILKIKENSKFTLIFTFLTVMIAIASMLYKISFSGWKFTSGLGLNVAITISLIGIGFVIIKQHLETQKIGDDLEKYTEYSKQTERLVEQYSISQHENKNELIIIRSMVHKSNKKLMEYLNEIITSKDNIENSWIRYLRYIPFGGLKGIIHNKVSEMKEHGIKVALDISKSIEKSSLKNLNIKENNQLSKIIGVFLDNAIDASIKTAKKEVVICIYLEDTNVIFEIANTYNNSVNINKIYDVGYSSKGKNRGYGLTLVKNIVEENKKFENNVKVEEEYFVQRLKVKLK